MAEAYNRKSQEEMNTTSTTPVEAETQDRGMFDFLGRKKEEEKKPAPDKPEVEEEKHHSLLEQMHRSDTPVPVEKKGFLEKMREMLPGQPNKAEDQVVAPPPPVKYEAPLAEVPPPQYQDGDGYEKKGIVEKVKEKLPSQHKKAEDQEVTPPPPVKYEAPFAEVPPPHYQDDEGYEKKGIAETVKEKLPGQHKNAEAPPPHYQDDEGYEKKGIVETVKEKLPGQHNKFEDQVVGPPPVKYEAPFAEVTPPSYQDSVVEEKKGIMEKMKETLPGQHKDAEDRETYAPPPPVKYQAPSGEAPPPSYQDREAEERKGVMEKIKEGLPGQHKNAEDREAYAPPSPMKYEAPSGEAPPPSYQDREAEEKKGIKEKIKEGLPAQHRNAEDREAYAPSPPMKYEAPLAEVSPPLYQDGEKNDILEKMKNLPGQHHKAENQEAYPHPLPPPGAYEALPAEVPPPQCQDGEVEGLIRTPEEKGFLVKMKEKLPGHHKKAEDQALASPPPPSSVAFEAPAAEVPPPMYQDGEAKEKKGIMEKIKEKLPGHHPKSEEDKEKKY